MPGSAHIEKALGAVEVARILGAHPRTVEREKLHRIWHDLLGLSTPENAISWLKHPVPALENRRPVEVMAEDGGLDRVLEVVGRMSWGIPA